MNLREAEDLALDLMEHHDLDDEWSFEFDRAKRRFGHCRYDDNAISLSKHLTKLNDREEVKDTLLHEIAHALAGPRAGHGSQWKQVCTEIGARPERCYDSNVVETPEREFVRACPSCGRTGCAHRRQVLYCGSCVTWQGRNEDTRFVWFRNGELLPGPHLSFCPECDVTRLRYSQSDGGVCACGDRLEWVGPVSERGRVENSPLLESIDFTAL